MGLMGGEERGKDHSQGFTGPQSFRLPLALPRAQARLLFPPAFDSPKAIKSDFNA
jgi:hypothetical protein